MDICEDLNSNTVSQSPLTCLPSHHCRLPDVLGGDGSPEECDGQLGGQFGGHGGDLRDGGGGEGGGGDGGQGGVPQVGKEVEPLEEEVVVLNCRNV